MDKKKEGFTLIEVIIFIVISSLLANTILLVFNNTLLNLPNILQNLTATHSTQKCMEWFIGQRALNGYNSIPCPSTTVPSFCTSPAGYSLAVNLACTSLNGDNNFKTLTITASGLGNATSTVLFANY